MLRLINASVCPPGGFRYRDEATGKEFHAWTLGEVTGTIAEYLAANRLPIPVDLEARIENYTCNGQGANVCEEKDARYGWLSGAALKFRSVIAGTEILGAWILAGKPFVPREQADQRSEVCAGCVHNVDPKDCAVCAWPKLHGLVAKLLGDRRSKRHADLKACASCGCNLQVKVNVPLEHLEASFGYGDVLPEWCWVSKEMKHD